MDPSSWYLRSDTSAKGITWLGVNLVIQIVIMMIVITLAETCRHPHRQLLPFEGCTVRFWAHPFSIHYCHLFALK
jgi:hypothetical protein